VISASASRVRLAALPLMRSSASTWVFSLPVRCSRSNPAPPATSTVTPRRDGNAAVVSMVTTSSPAPPTRCSWLPARSYCSVM